jgi:hypothetical protein
MLCQFLAALAGVALMDILGIDAGLGQVAIVVFVDIVFDNRGSQLQLSLYLLLLLLASAPIAVQGG